MTPPPRARESEAVSFDEPLHLRSQLDIADELTAALTTRMKPPPQPPRDIRPSTAIWLVLTGLAVGLLLIAFLTNNDFLSIVAVIGFIEIVLGVLWIVWMAYDREPKRGFLALLPPVNLWYMTRWKYGKYRPLRFTVTGVMLVALSFASGFALPTTRAWFGVSEKTPSAVKVDTLDSQPKLVQLRAYRDQPDLIRLVELLDELTKTDELQSQEASDRGALARDIKGLASHRDSIVRVKALEAYARWGGDDGRALCLKFLESPNQEERKAAIHLLPRWRDAESARAIAGQLGRSSGETTAATESLREIGGTLAEEALIPQLEAEDAKVRMLAMDLLASPGIGGPTALARLRLLATNPPANSKAFEDSTTRLEAGRKADILAKRLGVN